MSSEQSSIDQKREMLPPKFRQLKKQDLTDEEIAQQNIRGYAGLVQKIFDTSPRHSNGRENLINKPDLDPLRAIGLDSLKTRALIEVVEMALFRINPTDQEIIRLYFGLDKPVGTFMKQEKYR